LWMRATTFWRVGIIPWHFSSHFPGFRETRVNDAPLFFVDSWTRTYSVLEALRGRMHPNSDKSW
jgi:hypothetical protein